ncbi:MAG: acetyl-CoA carboxylase biotin carboxylase subunit [bacterium]
MISSLLIANRGEIAVRIVRACKELGIRSVVVFSEADRSSLAVRLADEAVCVGPSPARDSYLRQERLISAAVLKGCDAVHPGVGFLSEKAEFARRVTEAGLTFVGPDAETIALLGDKVAAKRVAAENRVPVIPGSAGSLEDVGEATRAAAGMGFPVIIKAAAGGGGKGMRVVRAEEEFERILRVAAHEAESAFSDGTVYLEKYLTNPRHVEIQVLADAHGNVIHLGERDCSVQLRHQKLIEESPSAAITPEMRERMGGAAVQLFEAVGYVGAGTVEFLVHDGNFYFMEVNARVQVEHPVTELVTGVDIIHEQLRAAAGEELTVTQAEVHVRGYAVECRINATAPGTVMRYLPPGGYGVRMDSFLYTGYQVPPHYDALVGKLLCWGRTREEGIRRMIRALEELEIEGLPTNTEEQLRILRDERFRRGDYGTAFMTEIETEVA